MDSATVTVVVIPREQFSKAERSLESLIACTPPGVRVIYVDGNSPRRIARYIERRARERGFTLLRTDTYLAANEARNLALAHVRTPYVAFVDNDVHFTPGWLEKLVSCAEETGAWAVGPLYLIDDPSKQIVHMAGAQLRIVRENGASRLIERHRFSNVPVLQVRDQLVRQRTDLVEFHCMLIRTNVFDVIGKPDEALLSFLDHVDFCLDVTASGGSIFIEPSAVVTHLAPPPFAWVDLAYFFLRFSDAWMEPSIRRFAIKRGLRLDDDEFNGHRRFRNAHRLRLLGSIKTPVKRIAGWHGVEFLHALFTGLICNVLLENVLVKPLERRRARSTPPAPPMGRPFPASR